MFLKGEFMGRKKQTVDNGLGEALLGSQYNYMNNITNPATIFANATNNLLSLQWIELTNTYKSNGFCRVAVDLPVADAFRNGGFELKSDKLTPDEIDALIEKMSDENDIEKLQACLRFGRLYGGGCIIINTDGKTDKPLVLENLKDKNVEFIPADRWQCYANGGSVQLAQSFTFQDIGVDDGNLLTFDKSKVLTYTGQLAPYYLRQQLAGWGMSIFETVIPQLKEYIKANGVILELLDEAKIDILKIDGLSQILLSAGGTQKIQKRIQIATDNKNYKSMLAMDSNDDYQQKQLSFGGLDRLLEKIFLLICATLRIPYSKVFGKGSNGLGTGADLDIENYLSMVDGEIRQPATKILKQMIDIRCFQLFGEKDETLKIVWKPMRVMSEKETQEIEKSKVEEAIRLLEAGILTKKQVAEKLVNEGIINLTDEEIEDIDNNEIAEQEFDEFQEKKEVVKNSIWNKIWKK